MGAMSIKNIVGFIWAVFTGIIALRVTNPLYNVLFGLTWNNLFLKFSLMFVFGIFVFAVIFFLPFKAFTEYADERGWDID